MPSTSDDAFDAMRDALQSPPSIRPWWRRLRGWLYGIAVFPLTLFHICRLFRAYGEDRWFRGGLRYAALTLRFPNR